MLILDTDWLHITVSRSNSLYQKGKELGWLASDTSEEVKYPSQFMVVDFNMFSFIFLIYFLLLSPSLDDKRAPS